MKKDRLIVTKRLKVSGTRYSGNTLIVVNKKLLINLPESNKARS